MKKTRVFILSFLLGFSSIIAQTIVLRSFQTVFYGNELAYALLLSSWLIWVALGSFLTTVMISRVKISEYGILAFFCVLGLGAPALIFGTRYIKSVFDIGSGEMMGLLPMMTSGFILSAPVGFCVGSIFVLLCYCRPGAGDQSGRVYFWESLGSGIGGMAFSFVLLKLFNTMMIAWLIPVIVILTLLMVYKKELPARFILSVLLVVVLACGVLNYVYHLDYRTQQHLYPFGKLLAVQDSPYANIAVVKRNEDISVYQNGMLSFTANDLLSAEENVHFAMLAHPQPMKVLLIGNGLGGEIAEILKYPDTQLDFVEIDPAVIQVVRRYLPQHLKTVLQDSRLTIYHKDARYFVRTAHKKYDVVIVNVGDPYTAGLNRYYTLEFFEELNRMLNKGGIVSFRVSSSENFLSEETRTFLRSLYATLKKVFPEVKSIPGDTHTFLVSNIAGRINLDAQNLNQRLRRAGVKNRFVTEYMLPFRVTSQRVDEVETILAQKPGMLNTDFSPRTYLYQILMWSSHFDNGLKRFVEYAAVPFWMVLLIGGAGIGSLIFWRTRRDRLACVDLAVATTGFSEIIFEIVVILAFQSLYGTAYDKIALILASFMFGLVFGARTARAFVAKYAQTELIKLFSRVQWYIVFYPILLPLLFVIFRDVAFFQQWVGIFAFVFAGLPFIAGFLGGVQYPLATAIRGDTDTSTKFYAGGFLYAVDVFGASIGALVTGAFLIPLYGIVAVCVLCVVVNGIVYVFLRKS